MSTAGQRRKQVLRTALKCFSERGAEATSIEMIRDLSGASVGSIYHHFGGKDGIALALYLEGLKEANTLSLRRLHLAQDAKAGVTALIGAFVDWVVKNPEWARYLYATGAVWATGPATELKALNDAYFSELEAWFRPYVAQRAVRDLPIVALVAIIFGPVFTYARRWLLGEASKSLKALTPVFAEAAWRGAAATSSANSRRRIRIRT